MGEDSGPGRRPTEETAAQLFDPVAFAKRLDAARSSRQRVLAQRQAEAESRPLNDPSLALSLRATESPSPPPAPAEPAVLLAPKRTGVAQPSASPLVSSLALLLVIGAAGAIVGLPELRHAGDLGNVAGVVTEPVFSSGSARGESALEATKAPPAIDSAPLGPEGLAPVQAELESAAPDALTKPAVLGAQNAAPTTAEVSARTASGTSAPEAERSQGAAPTLRALAVDEPESRSRVVARPSGAETTTAPPALSDEKPHVATEAAPGRAATEEGEASSSPADAPGTIAVHASLGVSNAMLWEMLAELRDAGYVKAWGVRVHIPVGRTQVRYFHAADAEAARSLAETLGQFAVRDFTHFSPPPSPGSLEIWLAGNAAQQVAHSTAMPKKVTSKSIPSPVATPPVARNVTSPAFERNGSARRSTSPTTRPARAVIPVQDSDPVAATDRGEDRRGGAAREAPGNTNGGGNGRERRGESSGIGKGNSGDKTNGNGDGKANGNAKGEGGGKENGSGNGGGKANGNRGGKGGGKGRG